MLSSALLFIFVLFQFDVIFLHNSFHFYLEALTFLKDVSQCYISSMISKYLNQELIFLLLRDAILFDVSFFNFYLWTLA